MLSLNQSDIEKQLAVLQTEFKGSLPDKIKIIEQNWNLILDDKATDSTLAHCYRVVLALIGTGATFGAAAISTLSRELEQNLQRLLDGKILSIITKKHISSLIIQLKDVADKWQPETISYLKLVDTKDKHNLDLIYLVDDDEQSASAQIAQLEKSNFRIECFSELRSFEEAFAKEIPAVL